MRILLPRMPRQRGRVLAPGGTSQMRPWLSLLALVPALLLMCCGEMGAQYDLAPPTPVVLRDPPPGQLDLFVSLQYVQHSLSEQPSVQIDMSLTSGGNTVEFAGSDELVTCPGASLSPEGALAVFVLVPVPDINVGGTTIHCDYLPRGKGGPMAGVTLHIPQLPAITSPQSQVRVQRSSRTPVTYSYDAATTTLLGIVALSSPSSFSSAPHKAVATLNSPAPLHATLDTSGFPVSAGSLVLTASLHPQLDSTGVPFRSARAGGSATVEVPVWWM